MQLACCAAGDFAICKCVQGVKLCVSVLTSCVACSLAKHSMWHLMAVAGPGIIEACARRNGLTTTTAPYKHAREESKVSTYTCPTRSE